jgi:hypothetical protein
VVPRLRHPGADRMGRGMGGVGPKAHNSVREMWGHHTHFAYEAQPRTRPHHERHRRRSIVEMGMVSPHFVAGAADAAPAVYVSIGVCPVYLIGIFVTVQSLPQASQ